jgi:hypothetical protein
MGEGVNGEVVNGQVNGQWSMVNGQWSMVNGQKSIKYNCSFEVLLSWILFD